MAILLEHRHYSVRVHKTIKCCELYRQASKLFSQDIKAQRFILYFINHKQIQLVPMEDITIEKLPLRSYPKKTTIRLMTEDVFSRVAPINSLSSADNLPSESSHWEELNQPLAIEKTLSSYEVIQEQAQQQQPTIERSIQNTMEAASKLKEIKHADKQLLKDQESLWEVINDIENKLKEGEATNKPRQVSRQMAAAHCAGITKKHKPRYQVEVQSGLNIKLELKPNETKCWQINFNNCGQRDWPDQKVGFYDLKTKLRKQGIPKLQPYSNHILNIDCSAKEAIQLNEYMFGYEHKGDLVTFGPIFRCLVSLDDALIPHL